MKKWFSEHIIHSSFPAYLIFILAISAGVIHTQSIEHKLTGVVKSYCVRQQQGNRFRNELINDLTKPLKLQPNIPANYATNRAVIQRNALLKNEQAQLLRKAPTETGPC